MVEFANNVGLPTEEGLFGFKPFAELWVGRLAMMGFITSIVEEFITGRGTLQQIGFETPDSTVLFAIGGLATVATLVATGVTLNNARTGKLTYRDLARYRAFLGIKGEDANIAATQKAMKLNGDFTSPTNPAAIEQAKAAGSPVDAFLSPTDQAALQAAAADLKKDDAFFAMDDVQKAAQAAVALKEREASASGSSVSLEARDEILEMNSFMPSDVAYAKSVEIENGRWAMLGFLSAVVVEAATGKGIISQLFMYAKLSGLLGAESGF